MKSRLNLVKINKFDLVDTSLFSVAGAKENLAKRDRLFPNCRKWLIMKKIIQIFLKSKTLCLFAFSGIGILWNVSLLFRL